MNLKEETLEIFEEIGKSICDVRECYISYRSYKDEQGNWKYPFATPQILCTGIFNIDKLDINYDDGYGIHEIFGFISFKDGTWMERGEYDGSERWDYKKCPTVEDYNV